jgi:hypothetical protein
MSSADHNRSPARAGGKRIIRRRLTKAALFAAVRGAATATGSGLAGWLLWWLIHR